MDTENNSLFSLQQKRATHLQLAAGGWAAAGPAQWNGGGDAQRYLFTHFSEFYPHSVINRGDELRELPVALRRNVAEFVAKTPVGELAFADCVENFHVDAAIVLHKGRVVFEAYPRMYAHAKHFWLSVSKIAVSLAVGVLEEQGFVDPSHAVCVYLPALKGTDWARVRVIDLLDMCSGIDCPQAFDDPNSNHWRLLNAYGCFGSRTPCSTSEALFDFLGTLRLHYLPGQTFEYSFINPMILTLLVEALTQQPFADFVSTAIWQPMGAAGDALMLNAVQGGAVSPFGMSSTLRDLARFGLLFTPTTQRDRSNRSVVVSERHIKKIQTEGRPELQQHAPSPNALNDEPCAHNTYQWDCVMADGDFYKAGAFGQGLYVSPAKALVIAFFSTTPGPRGTPMATIIRQLAQADIWV
ncbi:MAG: serine hydrolase domain-containing protein [Caldilineaceae bacterium]